MDYVEGRGVTSGNDVYFIYDAENDVVVMAMYKDAPGVRSDRLMPNVIKSFTKDEWGSINEFLLAGADKYEEEEGLKKLEEMKVDESFAPKVRDFPSDVIEIDSEGNVHPPEAGELLSGIQQLRKEEVTLPKVNNIPKMTEDDKKEENGTE